MAGGETAAGARWGGVRGRVPVVSLSALSPRRSLLGPAPPHWGARAAPPDRGRKRWGGQSHARPSPTLTPPVSPLSRPAPSAWRTSQTATAWASRLTTFIAWTSERERERKSRGGGRVFEFCLLTHNPPPPPASPPPPGASTPSWTSTSSEGGRGERGPSVGTPRVGGGHTARRGAHNPRAT